MILQAARSSSFKVIYSKYIIRVTVSPCFVRAFKLSRVWLCQMFASLIMFCVELYLFVFVHEDRSLLNPPLGDSEPGNLPWHGSCFDQRDGLICNQSSVAT